MCASCASNSTANLGTKIDIITLGCSKNLVDAERLMYQLRQLGYTCVHDPEEPKGEIAIINTCGFIGDAKEESIRTILEFAERKRNATLRKRNATLRKDGNAQQRENPLERLYVMGCLSERYLKDLEAEIPEVDGWYGKFNYTGIVEELAKTKRASATKTKTKTKTEVAACETYKRTITTPRHYAYLKIAEGCDRYCSYCAIPYITGPYTPRAKEEILEEARWLVRQGVKELNVIAQDLTSYPHLDELIEELAHIEGVHWIRLHYAYPTDFPYEILPVMARNKNVCRYLDIALQHASDHMLHLMRRHITQAEQTALIERIRREVPGICIRTTLIVGHPGETEEDYAELKDWVRKMRFERMGCFTYSHEEGTYAYRHYRDEIPDETKQKRQDELMAIQQQISAELQQERFLNREVEVVIDRKEGDYYIGRTEADSPEVDCEVLIDANVNPNLNLKIGEYYKVKITKTEDFDLYATIC